MNVFINVINILPTTLNVETENQNNKDLKTASETKISWASMIIHTSPVTAGLKPANSRLEECGHMPANCWAVSIMLSKLVNYWSYQRLHVKTKVTNPQMENMTTHCWLAAVLQHIWLRLRKKSALELFYSELIWWKFKPVLVIE